MSQPPQERLASIKALFEDQLKRRLFASSPLQPDDFNVMKRWVHGYVRRNEDELLKGATPQFRKRWDEAPAHRKFFMLGMMLTRDQDRMKEIPADELAVLTQHLSPQAKKSLEAAGKHERQLLLNWLRLAGYQLRNMAQQKVPNDMELRTFFNSLDDRRKERLESLPPAETKAALTILYQMDRQSASGFGGAAAVGLQPTQRPGAVKLAPNAGTGAKGPTAISPSRTIRKPSLQPRATGTRPFRAIDRRQTDVDSTGGPKKK